jgi:hypothetical protein
MVTITGHSTVSTQLQPDGNLRMYLSIAGSGITATGVRYAFSDETHIVFEGPFPILNDAIRFYDYRKLNRQRDEDGDPVLVDPFLNPPTGEGDDFFVRFFFTVPTGASGVPNTENSLMSTMDGVCR